MSNSLRNTLTPLYYNTVIRFLENITGNKVFFQLYPFMYQDITKDYLVRYKLWLPRMSYYERKLGHRFFLEESIHIMHLSFYLKDPVIISSWLKSMILRISFWKTRSIFRFIKYVLGTYFYNIFSDLGVKGFMVKLKGKISVAGNARKRSIVYKTGNTSFSTIDLRVVDHFQTITTFTGVMGFHVWIFY